MSLRVLIKSKGFSQQSIAKLIGKSQRLISSWINGVCSPSPIDALKLASILGVSEKQILECFIQNMSKEKQDDENQTR